MQSKLKQTKVQIQCHASILYVSMHVWTYSCILCIILSMRRVSCIVTIIIRTYFIYHNLEKPENLLHVHIGKKLWNYFKWKYCLYIHPCTYVVFINNMMIRISWQPLLAFSSMVLFLYFSKPLDEPVDGGFGWGFPWPGGLRIQLTRKHSQRTTTQMKRIAFAMLCLCLY